MAITASNAPKLHSKLGTVIGAGLIMSAVIIVLFASVQPWVEARFLFMDPLVAGEMSGDCCRVHYGLLSNLGVLMWCVTASVNGMAALVLWLNGRRDILVWCLVFGAVTSLILCIDDLFLVHEEVLPYFGVPQPLTVGVYGLITATYLACYRQILICNSPLLLIIALAGFGVSVGMDLMLKSVNNFVMVSEDGTKLVGIAAWMGFHIVLSARSLIQEPEPEIAP